MEIISRQNSLKDVTSLNSVDYASVLPIVLHKHNLCALADLRGHQGFAPRLGPICFVFM